MFAGWRRRGDQRDRGDLPAAAIRSQRLLQAEQPVARAAHQRHPAAAADAVAEPVHAAAHLPRRAGAGPSSSPLLLYIQYIII